MSQDQREPDRQHEDNIALVTAINLLAGEIKITRERRSSFRDWASIVIAASVAVWAMFSASSDSNRQAQIFHDTEERQLRAYLLVNIGKTIQEGSGTVDADLSVQQVGVTPAYDVWLAADIKIASSDRELNTNIWSLPTAQNVKWPNVFGADIKKTTIKEDFSPDEIRLMKQKGQKFYLFGAVCHITTFYRDQELTGRHEYAFCFSFLPGEEGIPCNESPYRQPMCPNSDP